MTELFQLREQYQISLSQAAKAVRVANERFNGDVRLGVLWTEADAFAINVRGGREARDRWNDKCAQTAVQFKGDQK